MIVINLYGAPGAGKSTGAAYIYSRLKLHGINVELVTEYAKDEVWEENQTAIDNQIYIFANQYYRLKRLDGKVDIVINDSPLLLSLIYNKDIDIKSELDALISKADDKFDNYDFLITRTRYYKSTGRLQTQKESDDIYEKIKTLLSEHGITSREYPGNLAGYEVLFLDICIILEKQYGIKVFDLDDIETKG